MAYTREQITKLIGEHQRVKGFIDQHEGQKKPTFSFFEMIEAYIDQRIAGIIAEMKPKDGKDAYTPVKGKDYFTSEELKQIGDYIRSLAPQKGVHYFDGKDGERGRDGIDGMDGEDGKSVSPEEAKVMIAALLKEIKVQDVGGVDEDTVKGFISAFEKKSGKNLEARLKSLQDAVMRNYGGHGMSIHKEIIGEVVSGSGTSWTLANTPSLFRTLWANGQRLSVSQGDYTISGASITTTNSWVAGSLEADYYK